MQDDLSTEPGACCWLEPQLRRVLAPNPSPMTHRGTNSYIVGEGSVALIDPGPALPAHHAALLAALRPGERISHILVTHAHLDHSPLAAPLAEATGAELLAFGPAARSPAMQALAEAEPGGGEGIDHGFAPQRRLADGESVSGPGWTLTALHTPGHLGDHLCFGFGDACFSGDHVMGWSSSLVSPPDGDMTAYRASLDRLGATPWRVLFPGHGAPVAAPATRIAWLAAHRRDRERMILDALAHGPAGLVSLTATVYAETPAALLPAARRNLLAHLVDLAERNRIRADPRLSATARFHLA
ncbi:MAG: MBL fold metallo-hydrolase [Cereibacter changlensis]